MTRDSTPTVLLPALGDEPRRTPTVVHKLTLMNKLARWKARHSTKGDPTKLAARREAEIHAYVGKNGHGKTLCMLRDTAETLTGIEWDCDQEDHEHTRQGITHGVRRVLSTVRIYDQDGNPHPLFDPLESLDQLAGFEHGDLLLDEIVGVAHSRDSGSLPAQIYLKLQQLRKVDVVVRWTAPDYARADKTIRETTKAVTLCEGGHPDRSSPGLWKANRYFEFHTYSSADFDEFTAKRSQKLDPLAREYLWAPHHPEVLASYDTRQSVLRLVATDDHGLCMACGGTRRRGECTCSDYLHAKHERQTTAKSFKADAPTSGDTASEVRFES